MPRRWARRTLALACTTLRVDGAAGAAGKADAVADFYRGKTVTLVVGYGPGGGYDVYARLVGRHLGRHIPGHPTVVVQNMPGAGSLRAVNWLNNLAPRDGTAIAHFARNMPLMGMLGNNANAQFDPRKFTWLGSSSSFANDAYILIVRKDIPVKTIDDARRQGGEPLVLGGTAEGATGNDVPIILRDTIGLNVKQVVGYPDPARSSLRWSAAKCTAAPPTFRRSRRSSRNGSSPTAASMCWCSSRARPGTRISPNVPTARELARNEAARLLIELTEIPYKLSRPFAAPPGYSSGARGGAAARRSRPPTAIRNILPTPPSSGSM